MMALRYREDRWPVLIVWSGVALSFVPFVIDGPAAWMLALTGLLCRILLPIHQHNHSDWRVHHGLGHHVDYLDQHSDFEGNFRFGDIRCRRLVFAFVGSSLSLIDSMKILSRFPKRIQQKHRAAIARQLLLQILIFTGLMLVNWQLTLLMFALPNFLLRAGVFWFSFGQHDDVPMTNVYDSSTTKSNFGEALLNVECHTAHHERPGLHWSRLRARTEEILPLIHEKCVR